MALSSFDVRNKTFTPVRLREGYDTGEVNAFLEDVARELDHASGTVTPDRVRDKRFTPVRIREGYDMAEVDQFLDLVVAALEERAAARTHDAPAEDSVEARLAALTAEVAELRARVSELEQRGR